MRIDIISLFPEMFEGPFAHSIISRAIKKNIAEIHIHPLREYAKNKHRQVDDYPYGGEAGMVIMPEPLAVCIEDLQSQRSYDEVIFVTPDAAVFTQSVANQLSLCENIIILCGHYKGIDERIREHFVTKEISIGDYVLSGGELAAAVICDAVFRLIPGVLSDETSALSDSFQNDLLSHPVYTRPADFRGWKVPSVLLSGDEKKIKEWQYAKAYEKTEALRPDLLKN